MEPGKSKKEVTTNYLMSMLKEKDEKIIRMKTKIEKLRKECAEKDNHVSRHAEVTNQDSFSLLLKINKSTGNRFDSIDECIAFIRRQSEDLQKMKRDYNKDEGKDPSPYSSDKQRRFDSEIEELNDRIYDLEMKMSLQDKKCKSQLKLKDDEIYELNEEIEIMKTAKPKDTKAKARIAELEESVEDLETELQSKVDELKQKERKIRDLTEANRNSTVGQDEINKLNTKHEQDVKRLRDQIGDLNQKLEKQKTDHQKVIDENTLTLEKKDSGLETMRKKMNAQNAKVKELDDNVKLLEKQLLDCQGNLEDALETVSQNHGHTEQLEAKIHVLEEEIRELRMNRPGPGTEQYMPVPAPREKQMNTPKERFDPVADKTAMQNYAKQLSRIAQEIADKKQSKSSVCPNCQVIFDDAELEDHLEQCLNSSD